MFPAATQTPAALAAHALEPAHWLALDLETGDAPEEAIQAALKDWRPPSNVKDPEKIANRREEAAAKIRERAALLDAAPVLCLALQTNREALLLNGMDAEAPTVEGWRVIGCNDERGMLLTFREWADRSANPGTVLVGHNHRGFDLPKLRARYVAHRLRLPAILAPSIGPDAARMETVDTMHLFKAFSMENHNEKFIALNTVATGLGIPRPKQIISGGDVPRLHREGGHTALILTYCAVDAATTARAYQLMTSTAQDLD